jgi:hypothetical protein
MATMKDTDAALDGRKTDWTWAGILCVILLVAAASYFLRRADAAKSADWASDELTYLPSGKFLKPMVLDQDAAAADLLWIRGMIYFADAYLEGKSYRWLGHILEIVTTLNPRFRPAYEFAGTVLTKRQGELPRSLALMRKGMDEFPADWKLRVYASMAQLSLDSNYVLAAEYLKPVTLDTNVPDYIRVLAASLLRKGAGRTMALLFLADRYLHSNNAIYRELFLDKMVSLYPPTAESKKARIAKSKEILQQVDGFPQYTQVAVGVLREYLADSLSDQSRSLLKLLEN